MIGGKNYFGAASSDRAGFMAVELIDEIRMCIKSRSVMEDLISE